LDGIQDPMNFGAILRTGQFLGVNRIITSRKNCAPLSPVVSKASAGAMETHPIFAVRSVVKFVEHNSLCGWEVLGASCAAEDSGQSQEIVSATENFVLHGPTILVLGNEGTGLRPSVADRCSRLITIPQSTTGLIPSGLDSLNVSVAAGNCMFMV
jgi:21S rRNA (GM2251-2'-O)-methyltransferase